VRLIGVSALPDVHAKGGPSLSHSTSQGDLLAAT
jgi:hypothetical protein